MKNMKKFAAILLAVIMLFAMTTTAFAANSVTDANTGSITILNPVADQDYTAYKIFDVAYNGNAYTYTIAGDSAWYATVAASGAATLTKVADGTNVYNVSDVDAAALAAYLKANKPAGVTGTAIDTEDNGTLKVTGLALGYYFVESTSGAVCNLTTTDPAAEIRDKNDMPFEKVDDQENVVVGQVVNYDITGKVPDTTGFTTYTYEVNDTMSAGLTFNDDVTVKVGGEVLQGNYTYEKVGNGFKVTVDVMALQEKVGEAILIEYSATVNADAIAQVETNKATLTYSNDPSDDTKKTTTPEDIEKVYCAKIIVDKFAAGNESTKLEGAKFVLKNAEDKFYSIDADKVVTWVDAQADATVVTTDANGAASFEGLLDGTYSMIETEAPLGYNKLTAPVEVVINGANATVDDETSLTKEVDVENSTGTELPSTGGIGTTIFYVVGGLLVVGALIVLVAKKRMSTEA